jgi:hypothetical protein
VPVDIVDPYDFDPEDYAFLLIGGGFLLRDPGDSFYDRFRVPGNHVLHAVGTATSKDLGYLAEYRKVTVRSESDRRRLAAGLPDVPIEVVPDPTLLLQPVDLGDLVIPENSVGVHVVADTLRDCDGIQEVLDGIPEHKVAIPFTHYNYDLRLMEKMNVQGDYEFLVELSPAELFTVIGRMKYVVVSSLHATIFAYSQNVPFLTFYQDKVHDYLVDRGLERYIFRNTAELKERLADLVASPPDFTDLIAADRAAVTAHLDELIGPHRSSEPVPPRPHRDVEYRELQGEGSTKETLMLDLHRDVLAHRDDLIHELIVRKHAGDAEVARLQHYKEALEEELQRVRNRLADFEGSLAHRFAARVQREYAQRLGKRSAGPDDAED